MNDEERAQQAAALLLRAHRGGELIGAEPFALATEEQAYFVQTLVADELGHRSGWKLGLDKSGMAIHAPLFVEQTSSSPARLKRSDFNRFLLECELAISFRRAMPPRTRAYTSVEVQSAAGFIHAAFEIVDTRFEHWPDVVALWLLADGLSHGGFVLGRGVELVNPEMLTHAAFELTVDGDIVQAAVRAHPQPDPWATLTQFVNTLSRHDQGLGEGDVVTTGTFSTVIPLQAGQSAEVCFQNIGCCKLNLF